MSVFACWSGDDTGDGSGEACGDTSRSSQCSVVHAAGGVVVVNVTGGGDTFAVDRPSDSNGARFCGVGNCFVCLRSNPGGGNCGAGNRSVAAVAAADGGWNEDVEEDDDVDDVATASLPTPCHRLSCPDQDNGAGFETASS